MLVEYGIDVNAVAKDMSGLQKACDHGHLEVVRFLLDNGVTLDTDNRQGQLALIAASVDGNLELMTLLLERGAGLIHIDRSHRPRCVALTKVIELYEIDSEGRKDAIELLLQYGGGVNHNVQSLL